MCYSAQVATARRKYERMTGAQIDYDQFLEIYGFRAAGESITIPRAIDLWFQSPDGAAELELRNLTMKYRAARAAEIESDLVKQRARLEAGGAKLASPKPTKKAAEDVRIAGDKIKAGDRKLKQLQGWEPTLGDDRIFPFHYAPVVIEDGGHRWIRLARYHCRQPRQKATVDRSMDGLYNARRDNLEAFWRDVFGKTHAVMLVESFFENVDRDGKNAVLHFTPKPADTMLIACVYAVWKDPENGRELLSYAAVTDDPPAEVAAAGHDRIIVNLAAECVGPWLTPQDRPTGEIQALLDIRQRPFYEHEVLGGSRAA